MNERKPKEKLHQPAITGNVCAFFLALALADFLNDNYTFFFSRNLFFVGSMRTKRRESN